jgi:hypothetical protein
MCVGGLLRVVVVQPSPPVGSRDGGGGCATRQSEKREAAGKRIGGVVAAWSTRGPGVYNNAWYLYRIRPCRGNAYTDA